MSNMTYVLTSILLSFLVCAIFMSLYKEEQKDDNTYIQTSLKSYRELISNHTETIDILRAHVYDLEQKLKEMEKLDDGK